MVRSLLRYSNINSKKLGHDFVGVEPLRICFVHIHRLWQTLNSELCSKHSSASETMIQIDFDDIMLKFKGYIKGNWGSPLIVAFIVLLFAAAVSLSIGLSSLADTVAVYAYFALVAGVFLQLACFLKNRGKSVEVAD